MVLPTSVQTPDQLGLKVDDVDSYLLHHQPIRKMSTSWSCAFWTITLKLLTIFSGAGEEGDIQFFWGIVTLSACQSDKIELFYFTQNSVSDWFSTGVQEDELLASPPSPLQFLLICYCGSQNSGNPFTHQITGFLQRIQLGIARWKRYVGWGM